MSIFGRLATMPLGDLLQWLSLTKRTGILSLDRGAIHKELFFHEGSLISASSSDPREFLSQVLLMHEAVSEKEVERLYRHLREHGGRLGQLMVEIGLVTAEELQRYLRLKAEESIYDCFLWSDGSFHFFVAEPTSGEHLPIVSELNAIILEGLRRADEWGRIRAALPLPDPLVRRAGPPPPRLAPAAEQLAGLLAAEPRRLSGYGLDLHWSDFVLYSAAAELARAGALAAAPSGAAASETAPDDHLDRELLLAGEAFARKDYHGARSRLSALLREAPHHPAARELLRRVMERETRSAAGLIALEMIPVMQRAPDEATAAQMSPGEQFLVSRIDGLRSVADLIHIAPLREAEIRELLTGFKSAGLVMFQRP